MVGQSALGTPTVARLVNSTPSRNTKTVCILIFNANVRCVSGQSGIVKPVCVVLCSAGAETHATVQERGAPC